MRSSWIRVGPEATEIDRRRQTESRGEGHLKTEAETGVTQPPAQGRRPGAPRSWKRKERASGRPGGRACEGGSV